MYILHNCLANCNAKKINCHCNKYIRHFLFNGYGMKIRTLKVLYLGEFNS